MPRANEIRIYQIYATGIISKLNMYLFDDSIIQYRPTMDG